ncbi:restriction modification system subunit S [Pectobacterium brasiliense]|uniref:restriction endonuclease subunit S n=1 Tax=Pectobacterium brasiliense TaxID=180957 RepID=UPI00057CC67C|nr:restriction endonuclease subunit S [Pectobacterium brasiliense]KHS89206.1 restriction modification system subunit S [Pectobacterium brasiliense]
MTFPSYDCFKSIDADWLGRVPGHWEVVRLRYLFKRVKRTNCPEKELLSVYRDYGVIPKNSRDDNHNKPSDDLSPYQLVESGDLVMNKMKAWQGSIAISEYEGIVSPAYFVYSFSGEGKNAIDSKYVHYLLRSPAYITQYMARSKGIRVNQWDLEPEAFEHIEVLLPTIKEQKAIATFLDRETQRIDSLIEEKQTFIKLLKEKHQALISHVVTKGLNSNVEMQDSGIEWIRQVPIHWGISKVRYLGQCQNGINIGGEFFGHGTPFVSYGDVYNNTLLPEKVQGLVLSTEKDQDNYSVIAGDVLFTRTSETIEEIGFSAVCKSTIEKAVFAGFLIRFRPDQGNLEIGFSEYYFRNEKLRAFFAKEMNLVTRASLSQDLLKKMPVLLPPIDEQNEIANYLQAECNKFSEIFAETEKTILLLKERKTSLISAAVTGKIDVREAV